MFKNEVVHPQVVTDAHRAGCAAGKQGKFVAFKDAFWDKAFKPYAQSQGKNQAALGAENIMAIAKELGLDTDKLKADMEGECKAHVEGDMAELAKFRVGSTPTFFVNGKFFPNPRDKNDFKKVIDDRLRVAEASGVSGADYYEKEVMGKGEKQFRAPPRRKPK